MSKSGRYASNRIKVESLTANKTVTVADCGTLFMLNQSGGLTSIVLPSAASAGNGWWAHFVVGTDGSKFYAYAFSADQASIVFA